MGAKCITAKQYAANHGVNYQYVRVLCNQRKIKGAKFHGGQWEIPEDAKYPAQKRVKQS